MENSTIKTIEELHSHRISQVLSDAKISSFDLNRDCQILQFSQKCLPHEARLMEVTEEILALLERGEK